MCDVILFGGTDEGHKISDFLTENNISHVVCVATEYGGEALGNRNVRVGRMTSDEMRLFFKGAGAKIVVDATHPYACEVTRNIRGACECRYIRVEREDTGPKCGGFGDAKAAADFLKTTEGNILITTGAKELPLFSELVDRAYARVLPSADAVIQCRASGFAPERIICMQGPFSKQLNSAVMREFNIKYLVTKRSGKSGGFEEKIAAARDCGVECVIINRPSGDGGVSVVQAENLILELL